MSTDFNHRQWRLAVLRSRELTDGQKVDLLARDEHCKFETGTGSWLAKSTISEISGHHERQVYRSDKAGQEAGLLRVTEERKGRTTVFSLLIPLTEETPLAEETGVPLTERTP